MLTPKTTLERMARLHPHSEGILKAFVPMLEAQEALANDLPMPELPALKQDSFAQGRPWMPVKGGDISAYLDEAFIVAAAEKIGAAALGGFPDKADEVRSLTVVLEKEPGLGRELTELGLEGRREKIEVWAKKQGQDMDVSHLFAINMAAATARRVEKACRERLLPAWNREYCPVCGSRPHGSFLRGKEGRRFLQCSLCRREWEFSRTTCPACGQTDPKELAVFFHQDFAYERAEVCNKCNHYLLSVDTRELSGDTLSELYLLCMTPLDILMQEKDYIPVGSAE